MLAVVIGMVAVVRWEPSSQDALRRGGAAATKTGRGPAKPPRRAARPEPPPIGGASAIDAATAAPGCAPAILPPVCLDRVDRDLDLHGVVVRADGAPVPGADVETFTQPWRDLDAMNYEARDERVAGPSTRTSTDGSFCVSLGRGAAVTLVVRAAGLRRVELPSRRAGERVRVVLDEGVTLRVRARAPDGAAAAGVALRVLRGERHDINVTMDARTDADGRCTFAGLPPDNWVYVTGQRGAPHRVGLVRVALPASGTVDAEVVVTPGKKLTGRVVDEDGDPIADAEVALDEDFPITVTTNADGKFVLDGWSGASDGEVHARAQGFAQRGVVAGTGDVEIRLTPAASARGRVVDAAGTPLTGALVSLVGGTSDGERPWPVSTGHAVAGADGTFEITGLDASLAHVVVVGLAGHGRVLAPVKLEPGTATTDLGDVVLAASRTVTGRVLGRADAPIARTVIWMVPAGDDPAHPLVRPRGTGQRETATDDLGRFAFTDCGPGGYTVIVRSTGAPEASRSVQVPADADPAPLEIRLTIKSEIVVRVVDGAGAPVGGVWVMATSPKLSPASATTGADGSAKLAIGGDGTTIRAIPGDANGRKYVAPAPAPVDGSMTQMTIVLSEGSAIAGRIVDADGKPIARAQISVRQSGRAPSTVYAKPDGTFRTVIGVAAPVELVFEGIVTRTFPNGGETDDDCGLVGTLSGIAPGATDAIVRCERRTATADVVFRAVAPDGSPLAGAMLSYGAKDTGTGGFVQTGPDGTVRVKGLAPKTFALAAMQCREFCPPAWVDFVPAGQEIVLRWRASHVIAGKVAFEDGTSPEKADVRVTDAAGYSVSNDLRKDGAFRFNVPVDGGPWRVAVRGRDAKGAFEGVAENVTAPSDALTVRLTR